MSFKSDDRGITLIELIAAIALLTILLSAAYSLLFFSTKSLNNTEAEFTAQEDARNAARLMEEDIRKAQAAYYDSCNHKAVETVTGGMRINVHTDTDGDDKLEMVQYKLENNQLKRGEADLGLTPTVWTVIAGKVNNNLITPAAPIFTISNETININLIIIDEKNQLKDDPVSVTTIITVRSKGAME